MEIKTKAWLSSRCVGDLAALRTDGELNVDHIAYATQDMTSCGWFLLGDATVTINLLPPEQQTQAAVLQLREKVAEVKEAAAAAVAELEGQINSLLALTME